MRVNVQKLIELVRAKRADRSFRVVANEIGSLSASALCRLEQGVVPTPPTLYSVSRWLGIPFADLLLDPSEPDYVGDTPQQVEALLRADPLLDSQTAAAISRVVRLAYDAAVRRTVESSE